MLNVKAYRPDERVRPPFNFLQSFLCCAEILTFWDYSDEVFDLCLDLNHNSRNYILSKVHMRSLRATLAIRPCVRFVYPFGVDT